MLLFYLNFIKLYMVLLVFFLRIFFFLDLNKWKIIINIERFIGFLGLLDFFFKPVCFFHVFIPSFSFFFFSHAFVLPKLYQTLYCAFSLFSPYFFFFRFKQMENYNKYRTFHRISWPLRFFFYNFKNKVKLQR